MYYDHQKWVYNGQQVYYGIKIGFIMVSQCITASNQGLFQQFWEKAPGVNWEKKIDLTSKLGEIHDIEHYKGSKIYPQNQVILDCIMPSIPLKH